jgi:hypothetical protein
VLCHGRSSIASAVLDPCFGSISAVKLWDWQCWLLGLVLGFGLLFYTMRYVGERFSCVWIGQVSITCFSCFLASRLKWLRITANNLTQFYDNDPMDHIPLGIILVGLFVIQPLVGAWHHRLYKLSKASNLIRQGHICSVVFCFYLRS